LASGMDSTVRRKSSGVMGPCYVASSAQTAAPAPRRTPSAVALCRAEGAERFALFVGAAVLANNLMIVAALLTKRSARRRKATRQTT
jgi:hypothetical protein